MVRIGDADVVLAGDLVEESDKPWIGKDSWPLEWPTTLDVLLESITAQTLVVPGHGEAVDRPFVQTQRDEIDQIAATVRTLASLNVSVDRAPAEGEWPWAVDERIVNAVTRGFEALASDGTGPG